MSNSPKVEMERRSMDELCINTIRTLSMDAVQKANSGHPGTAMAMAPVVYSLWQEYLRFDPDDPIWPNRDRFVLSIGHASMLLYSMLHLTRVKAVNPAYERLGEVSVTLDDIKGFRQLDTKCPGHPEYRWTSGIETTTGPLGQGVATTVGMAMGAKWMSKYFNRPGFEMIDYDVYALCGDGCMMEGVSSEAASLAGHLRLNNLCWVYDNNKITIEGNTSWAFSEDVATRFAGYGSLGKHMRFVECRSRKLARTLFHQMVKFGPKLERRQNILGRLVEVGTELFAMATSCAKVLELEKQNPGEKGPRELADLFCRQARLRISQYFRGVCCNTDVKDSKTAAKAMDGGYDWLEKGIVVDDGLGFKGKK